MSYCPNCKQEIEMMALSCPHCKKDFTQDEISVTPPLRFRALREILMAIIIYIGWVYLLNHELMTTCHHPDYTLGDLLLFFLYIPFHVAMILLILPFDYLFGWKNLGFTSVYVTGLGIAYLFAKILYLYNHDSLLVIRYRRNDQDQSTERDE